MGIGGVDEARRSSDIASEVVGSSVVLADIETSMFCIPGSGGKFHGEPGVSW